MDELMAADAKTDYSSYFGYLISEVYRTRQDKKKGSGGRPKKEDEEEEVRNIPHPDQSMNKGVMVTQSEYEFWYERRGETPPPIPQQG